MHVSLEPGVYVVAVSGGVDSMALLDTLRRQPEARLIVAHFDHGIRSDSELDRQLVQTVAGQHGLPFIYDRGNLGTDASEDAARRARYAFLHRVREAAGARAIITAHHEDDLLETAILNIIRGTGRRGLTSLQSRPVLQRPLLNVSKRALIAYAKDQGLIWREDSTNQDLRYLRNYVRHRLVPRFSPADRAAFLGYIRRAHATHHHLERQLVNHLHLHPALDQLDRYWFTMLPHGVAREVMATWLRRHGVKDLNSRMLERLIMAAKTYAAGQSADIDKTYVLQIEKKILALRPRDR